MSEGLVPSEGALPLSDQRRLDAIADRFEHAWQQGRRPRPEDWSEEAGRGPEQSALLRELLRLELYYRRRGGEHPSADEYLRRFPEHPELVRAFFPAAAAAETPHFPPTTPELETAELVDPDLPEVPGYEVLGELGRGGMGVVYLARQIDLNRRVALKMILSGEHAGGTELARFRAETEAVARLQHPNIVQVHEVGEAQRRPYCALEFVEGGSLAQKLRGAPLPARQAAELTRTLALAVHAAHERGIVHRDLKPANILLAADGTPKIADFGLAKLLDKSSDHTQTGVIVGTPRYMAPEQAAGRTREIGPLSDVYALGAILYELLTGRPPFEGTVAEVLDQVRNHDPMPPWFQRGVPRDLGVICLKCLRKDPGKRYASARELANDLRRFLASEPIRARPVGPAERLWRWARRNPALAILAAVIVASAIGAAGAAVQFGRLASEAVKAAGELETTLYFNRIALAERELAANNVSRAEELLRDCPEHLRGLEWHCLHRLLQGPPPTLRGHAKGVWEVALSPDGKRLASASVDGTVRVWDTETGAAVRTIRHLGILWFQVPVPIMGVALSPDGRYLATGRLSPRFAWKGWLTWRDEIRVQDAATGQDVRILAGHEGFVVGLTFSHDSRLLASSTTQPLRQSEVKVWDLGTGKELHTLRGHDGPVKAVAFSPGDMRLATGGADGLVKVWDATTGRELLCMRGHSSIVSDLAFHEDGRRLASASMDGTVRVWDAAGGQELVCLRGHAGPVFTVVFSPDGQRLISGGYDKTVRIWHATTGQELLTLRGHTDMVWSVAFSRDGQCLVSGSWDNTVKVWSGPSWKDSDSRAPLVLRGHTDRVDSVAFSKNGRRLASSCWDYGVKVWDVASGQELHHLHGHTSQAWGLAFSPDGTRLASGSWDRTVKVWDPATGQELLTFRGHENLVHAVSFSPDGRQIASASFDGSLIVWDPATGKETRRWKAHLFPIFGVSFSPDGKRLAAVGGDRMVTLWDVETGQRLLALQGHAAVIHGVAFSPDGQYLASASWDGTARVWDATDGKPVVTFLGHNERVNAVAFSPDGQHVASAGEDKAVKVWSRQTGKEVRPPIAVPAIVWSLAFSPDGKLLASAGEDRVVRVWDVASLSGR